MHKKMALLMLNALARVSFLSILYVGLNFASYAQNNSLTPTISAATAQVPDVPKNNPPPVINYFEQIGRGYALGEREYVLSLLVTILTGVILILKCVLFWKAANYKPEQILQSFAVIFIIGGGLLLITAGYTSADVAPVMGLFGTIAGYLIGKEQSRRNKTKKSSSKVESS